jgi:hypothetical protein
MEIILMADQVDPVVAYWVAVDGGLLGGIFHLCEGQYQWF